MRIGHDTLLASRRRMVLTLLLEIRRDVLILALLTSLVLGGVRGGSSSMGLVPTPSISLLLIGKVLLRLVSLILRGILVNR